MITSSTLKYYLNSPKKQSFNNNYKIYTFITLNLNSQFTIPLSPNSSSYNGMWQAQSIGLASVKFPTGISSFVISLLGPESGETSVKTSLR